MYHGFWNNPHADHELHKKIDYKLNSEGYRSKEFKEGTDILTLGCSFTFGTGLPMEYTWPQILSNKTNLTVDNLAQPGDSAQGQIRKSFLYFKKYGNPKIIIGLFPVLRMEFPIVHNKLDIYRRKNKRDKKNTWNFLEKGSVWQWDTGNEHEKIHKIKYYCFRPELFQKYSKAPHSPDMILPPEVGIFYTFNHIYMLEQYCKTNNIKFIWSLWEDPNLFIPYLQENDPESLLNYCEIKMLPESYWNVGTPVVKNPSCHTEFLNDELFYTAADRENGTGHWGRHQHIHLADTYYDKI